MFPPHILFPISWVPSCRHTQVHNGPCRYKLCDGVLTTGGVGLTLLHAHFQHFLLQVRVHPHPFQVLMQNPPRQYPYHPMVEPSHRPSIVYVHDPRLQPVYNHCLHHRYIKISDACTSAPSRPSTHYHCVQFFISPCRSRITSGQSSSDADRTRPRYLNDKTAVKRRP